jgi:hypothetical protein
MPTRSVRCSGRASIGSSVGDCNDTARIGRRGREETLFPAWRARIAFRGASVPGSRATCRGGFEPMADKVKGPAAYFPSIEAKYGRSIAEWKALMAETGLTS